MADISVLYEDDRFLVERNHITGFTIFSKKDGADARGVPRIKPLVEGPADKSNWERLARRVFMQAVAAPTSAQ